MVARFFFQPVIESAVEPVGAPAIAVTGDGNFGTIVVGSQRTLSIDSTGTADLQITSITPPAGFVLANSLSFPLTIIAGDSVDFILEASSVMSVSGDVVIANNSDTSPYNFAVTATIDIDYALNDEFTTPAAAPLASPRTAEPGPGTGLITDTGNNMNIIAGSELGFIAGTGTWGNPGIRYTDVVGAHVGRIIEIQYTYRANATYNWRYGWMSGGFTFADVMFLAPSQALDEFYGFLSSGKNVNDSFLVRIVAGVDRAYWFVKGDIYTDWTFLGIGWIVASQANVFPAITNLNAVDKFSHIKVWDTHLDNFMNQLRLAYSADGSGNLVGAGDGTVSFVWTVQANDVMEIHYCETDSTHRMTVRCTESSDQIVLIQHNGTESNVAAPVAQTWTPGSTYMVSVRFHGSGHQVVVNNTLKISGTNSFNTSATGVSASGFVYGRDLLVMPRTISGDFGVTYARGRKPLQNFWFVGDSKTAGTGAQSWPQFLCRLLNAQEMPARCALGGRSTAQLQALIDAHLASIVGVPDMIFYNMGANDTASMVEATWKANTSYIWNAITTKFPGKPIGVVIPWRAGFDATFNTMAGWIYDLLPSHPNVFILHDERDWMKWIDNGARFTDDGTHPRIQEGYYQTALQAAAGIP